MAETPQTAMIITDDNPLEGVSVDLAVAYQNGEIDTQVRTAKAFPRKLTAVRDKIKSLANLDPQTAEECSYSLPRGGKPIKGPSIRFAEIVMSQYGNCRAATMIVHVDRKEKVVIARAMFHDLETNVATTAEVRRRIVDRNGRIYNDDMIIVTCNAAMSIAKRNAILGAVPKALWREAYETVELTIRGDLKTLTERRDKAIKAFADFGLKPDEIVAYLKVPSVADITLDDLQTLIGLHSGIKNGETTVEEIREVIAPPKIEEKKAGVTLGTSDDDDLGAKTQKTEEKPKSEPKAKKKTEEPEKAAEASDIPADTEKAAGDQPSAATTSSKPQATGLIAKMIEDVERIAEWGGPEGLEAYIARHLRDERFQLLMGLDEHLPLYDYIKTLPVWQKADNGSTIYTKIKSGF